jgi:hypothetical protein
VTDSEPDAGALLSTLRAALAHEINQPLAVARGYLELLETRDDEAMRQMAPERIREAIERASLLVDDLAALLALELGGPVETDAGPAVVASACERAGPLAAARRVALDVQGEPGSNDAVAVGAVIAGAVERAERGSTVRIDGSAGGVRASWQGERLGESVAAGIAASRWRGDSASLAGHVARRRLERLGGELLVEEQALAALTRRRPPAPS